jgi:glyoxylase-like metal-dependent hydrolase (beta-lactamase superfamily II)
MTNIPKHLYSIRGIMGCCHILVDGDKCVIIDAGLIGEAILIQRLFRKLDLKPESLSAILLTHGHLDHAGNLHWLKRWSGATIYAHPAEQRHIDGTYPYVGITRWCGRLEATGRTVTRYKSCSIDVPIADRDVLPFWGALEVVHLPGHTEGHCGFYSKKHDLLFSGDMFASYFFNVHLPPAILNSVPEKFPNSFKKIRALNPQLIIPGHYDFFDGVLHRERFDRLCERIGL